MKSLAVVAAAAAVLVTGCGSSSDGPSQKADPKPKTFAIAGTVSVWAPDISVPNGNTVGAECSSKGGYEDITMNADVVVRDASGTKVGLGRLGPGVIADAGGGLPECTYPLEVSDVPDTGEIFTLQIGSHPEKTLKRADLDHLELVFK